MELLIFSVLSVSNRNFNGKLLTLQYVLWWWLAVVCPQPWSWALHLFLWMPPTSGTEHSSFFFFASQCADNLRCIANRQMWGVSPKLQHALRSTLQGILWQMLYCCLLWDYWSIFPGLFFSLSLSWYPFRWCLPMLQLLYLTTLSTVHYTTKDPVFFTSHTGTIFTVFSH